MQPQNLDVTGIVQPSPPKNTQIDTTSPQSSKVRGTHSRRRDDFVATKFVPTSSAHRIQASHDMHRSNPGFPGTIPDSSRPEMAAMYSQPDGDTQPISQDVFENYKIRRRNTLNDAEKPGAGLRNGTCDTDKSTSQSGHQSHVAHIDLVGEFEQPSAASSAEPILPENEDFDPLSQDANVRAELYPEDKRFQLPKTPAINGKKRDFTGRIINTEHPASRPPLNPFAGQMAGLDQIMNASQIFKITQAPSSPTFHMIHSDGLSERPSPDMYTTERPATAGPLSSPSRMGLTGVRAVTEPQTKYISMQESQAERDRLAGVTRSTFDKTIPEISDDDFDSEGSQVRRRRLQKKRALQAKRQFDNVTAPARPNTRNRKENQVLHREWNPYHQPGEQPNDAVIISNEIAPQGNVTEDETEQGDSTESETEDIYEVTDENKENVDVPMTVSKSNNLKTLVVASQSTPLHQGQRNFSHYPSVKQPGGTEVGDESKSVIGNDKIEVVETRGSTVADRLTIEPRKDFSKLVIYNTQSSSDPQIDISQSQRSHVPGASLSVPSSSPVLARKNLISPIHDQQDKTGVFRDQLSENPATTDYNPSNSPSELHPAKGDSRTYVHALDDFRDTNGSLQQQYTIERISGSEMATNPQQKKPNTNMHEDIVSSSLSNISTVITPITISGTFKPKPFKGQSGASLPTTMPSPHAIVKPKSKPTAESVLPETSTISTLFETAQTNISDVSTKETIIRNQKPPEQPTSFHLSNSLQPRSLAQVAADPSPPDGIGEVDVDIDLLNSEDLQFQAVIERSSPIELNKRRRRTKNRPSLEAAQPGPQNSPPPGLNLDLRDTTYDAETVDELAARTELEEVTKISTEYVPLRSIADPKAISIKTQSPSRKSRGRPEKTQSLGNIEVRPLGKGKRAENEIGCLAPNISPLASTKASKYEQRNLEVVSNRDIVAPDRVFAHFNGYTSGYYPATCLGMIGVEKPRYQVRFDDGTKDQIGGFGIKRLELRVGDTIKVDLGGSRTKSYVVHGFKNEQSHINTGNSAISIRKNNLDSGRELPFLSDIYGNTAVIVSAKQRRSVDGNADMDDLISVPVRDVYLTQTMWTSFRDRPYTYFPGRASSSLTFHTCSDQPSTSSSPSCRNPINMLEATDPQISGLKPRQIGGLFENFVFVITTVNDKYRGDLINQISNNNGCLLVDGFDKLFAVPELESAWPIKQSPHKLESNSFRLVRSAEKLGFTCLIADQYCRTEKYIEALALGIPCLATPWVNDCIKSQQVLPWEDYLLASGKSLYLNEAVRSRILPSYPPSTVTLSRIIESRPRFLKGQSILLIMTEKMKSFPFFAYALGANKVASVESVDAAAKAAAQFQEVGKPWDWIYYPQDEKKDKKKAAKGDGPSEEQRKKLIESVKRMRTRVVGNKFLIECLILGKLID